MTTQEEHKRNLQNKAISKEDIELAIKYVDDINNVFAFEKYCGNCYNFNSLSCPFLDKVVQDTEWKLIGCDNFID